MPRFQSCLVLVMIAVIAGAMPGQDASKPEKALIAAEQKLLELTNAERKKEELPPLKAQPVLTKTARAHSQNMAKQQKLEHDLEEKTPFDRMKEAGYRFVRAGENIAFGTENLPLADIMKLWMESEGHKANILSKDFTEIGIGVARNDKGEVYYTQVFGTPLK